MSNIGLDPQEEFSEAPKSVQICEDPNSKAHLEALFNVLNTNDTKDIVKEVSGGAVPMIKRKLPDSFFSPKDRAGMRRLGPSISVGSPSGYGAQHNRSVSMPVTLSEAHSRQLSLDSAIHPIPPGWEEARTPDGLAYYIDHNTRTTTWEDPRKRVSHGPLHPPHLMPPMPPYPQAPQIQMQQNTGSNPSVDTMPLPEGWQKAFTAEGEPYYVNHKNRTTSWFHPSLPQHHHSHSFAGVRAVGQAFPNYSPQHGLSAHQEIRRLPYEGHHDILQQHSNVMEASHVPATLYNDPYLSSNHIRQASHDSGLGVTAMPYQSDVGMEFEESMDTGSSISKVPMNRDYLDSMPATDIDSEGLQSDPQLHEQMEGGDVLGRWV